MGGCGALNFSRGPTKAPAYNLALGILETKKPGIFAETPIRRARN